MDASRTEAFSTVVGLDIETTGLDPTQGEIIEVAAIRYSWPDLKEIDRFDHLCSAKQTISPFITSITGISEAMVGGKPFFADISENFLNFIGHDVVFAHNANFDLGFLKAHGAEIKNPSLDTFKLSSVAWPTLDSYNLGSLQRFLNLVTKGEHRAAYDIEVTAQLLAKIYTTLTASDDALTTINHILDKTGQGQYKTLFSRVPEALPANNLTRFADEATSPYQGEATPDNIDSILGPEGLLSERIPGFTVRNEQVLMASEVQNLFKNKKIGLIEAGTGTGKTYAYAVPILLYLAQREATRAKQVFISTHSRYLQDQLIATDLPRLQQALGTNYSIASLKGKNNYVCSARVASVALQGTYTIEESWVLIKIVLWLDKKGSGDLEHLNLSHQPYFFIKRLTANHEKCRLKCTALTCVYQKTRSEAQKADIVVINHALLLTLKASDYVDTPLIIDEAHHLPHIARQATTIDFSSEYLSELLNTLVASLIGIKNNAQEEHIATLIEEIKTGYEQFLSSVGLFLSGHSPKRKLLLNTTNRHMSSWQKIAQEGLVIVQRLHFLKGLIQGLKHHLTDDKLIELQQAEKQLSPHIQSFEGFLNGQAGRIQWLELQFPPKESPHGLLGDMAQDITKPIQAILGENRAVIMTSATLTTGQSFEYIKKTLGIIECNTIQLPSSFNYPDQMLIYIVEDSPFPSTPSFEKYTSEIITKISLFLKGKTLGLFTSHTAIKSIFNSVNSSLYKENIKLLAQNINGGRSSLVERFKKGERAVLLGTNSFWEGLDIPGESLSAVIIPKLPFMPPDDPVLQTRSAQQGFRAFEEVSVPDMLLRLRQGVGRLIRTTTDFGIVVIIDSRFLRSSYRDQVLKSFPPATIHIGKKSELLSVVENWFRKK